MNIYLKNYCKSLFNCKGIVSISDTQKYISNNEFDINEILSYLQECININDIFNLANSKNFYKGHNLKEKYLLLLQFFNIIHNYSKNLILRYEVYSTKSIKKTTSNISDCLIYIPHYENYLLDLLGYIYDDEKSEWYFDSKISLTGNLLFAATCILCGYAHQKLMKIMEETNFPEGDDDIKFNQSTLLDKENNWTCISCSFSNDFKSVNCEMCFHSCQIEVKESNKLILNNLKKNQWKCNQCTFINDIANEFCNVCESGRNISYSISNISLNATPSKNNQKSVLSENVSENITLDRNKNKQRERQTPSGTNLIKSQSSNQWECTHCTFINKKENLNCEACSKACNRRPTYKPENFFQEKKTNSNKNSPNKMARSKSEHVLNNRKPEKWSCEGCTYLNEKENLNCEACSKACNKRPTHKPKYYSQENKTNSYKNSPNKISRSKSEHVLNNRKPEKWSCEGCTYINEKESLNCEACSKKRYGRIHKTYPQGNHRNDINRSTSGQNLINRQSHQIINKKENLSEIPSKKPDVKNHPDNSFFQNTPSASNKSKDPTIKLKDNRQPQPSNKRHSDIDKRIEIHQNPPIDKNSTKISPKICKFCKKEKKNRHFKCKMKSFVCGVN